MRTHNHAHTSQNHSTLAQPHLNAFPLRSGEFPYICSSILWQSKTAFCLALVRFPCCIPQSCSLPLSNCILFSVLRCFILGIHRLCALTISHTCAFGISCSNALAVQNFLAFSLKKICLMSSNGLALRIFSIKSSSVVKTRCCRRFDLLISHSFSPCDSLPHLFYGSVILSSSHVSLFPCPRVTAFPPPALQQLFIPLLPRSAFPRFRVSEFWQFWESMFSRFHVLKTPHSRATRSASQGFGIPFPLVLRLSTFHLFHLLHLRGVPLSRCDTHVIIC